MHSTRVHTHVLDEKQTIPTAVHCRLIALTYPSTLAAWWDSFQAHEWSLEWWECVTWPLVVMLLNTHTTYVSNITSIIQSLCWPSPGHIIVTIIHFTRLCVCCNMFPADLLFIFTLTAAMGQRGFSEPHGDAGETSEDGDTFEDGDDLPDYIVPFTLIHRNQRSFFQPPSK